MIIKPAIVVVAYDREHSLQRLLSSIANAYYEDEDITLIISIDFSESNEAVLKAANSFEWKYGEKRIVSHENNIGLRKHVLECGDYSLEFGAVIILEDDLVVAPDFYNFAKKAQNFYKEDERIAGVALYSHEWNGYIRRRFEPIVKNGDVYFGQFSISWGQSWTSTQWKYFKEWYMTHQQLTFQDNMPENICGWSEKSWGKYFAYYILDMNKYYVVPYLALSTCFSEAGVHFKNITLDHQVRLNYGIREYQFVNFEDGVHYDIFFENMDLIKYLKKYTKGNTEICINLYGKKKSIVRNYKYVLTTRKMEGEVIHSFGLQMRPMDMNIIYETEGDDILLYKCNGLPKETKRSVEFKILNYEAQGMPWQDACKYGVQRAWEGLKMILQR